jgi:hypothetical protein
MEYLIKLPWRSCSCYSRTHRHAVTKRRTCVTLRCERNKKNTLTFLKEQQLHLDVLVILLHNNHRHVSATRGAVCRRGGGENKHTSRTIMCRNHSTVKKHMLYLVCYLTVRVSGINIIHIFSTGVLSAHYNCICIFVLITQRMATWVAETCRWLHIINLHSHIEVYLLAFFEIHIWLTHGTRNMQNPRRGSCKYDRAVPKSHPFVTVSV